MTELLSKIESFLQKAAERERGLQFIVFMPGERSSLPFRNVRPKAANYVSIDVLIRLHGLDLLGHTAQHQIELWEARIAAISQLFARIERLDPVEADGSRTGLKRLTLDIEVGGLFYASLGAAGAVFAATLDQQPLNSGEAEQHFIAAVNGLASLLNGTRL